MLFRSAFYNSKIATKIHSTAMKATAIDSISDCCATLVVLVITVITYFTKTTLPLDGICGIIVGIFIFLSGINAAKETINPLLGQSPNKEFIDRIEAIVHNYPDIIGIHDLIVHDYGPGRVIISLHAEVSSSGNLVLLHDIIDNIEKELQQQLHCSATIHLDPISNDAKTTALKIMVADILCDIDTDLTFHDFRVVTGPTHTNLIFDVVVPFQLKLSDKELEQLIQNKLSIYSKDYHAVIEIDKSF